MSKNARLSSRSLFAAVLCMILLNTSQLQAQTCPLTPPVLFGQSITAVYCRSNSLIVGINGPDPAQDYTFGLYAPGGSLLRSKGGPLDGSGSSLSVASFMRSASDAGQYVITTSKEGCVNTLGTSFFAYWAYIDNLTITAWGGNAVSFRWASCGPKPDVTYEYAVTTIADPTLGGFTTFTTTDTFATRTLLTPGATYYIHVRVLTVSKNNQTVQAYFDCPVSTDDYPWRTNKFVNCSGVAPIGSITPVNSAICTGGSVTLTASGSSTNYKWYRDNVLIAGTTATTSATVTGQYTAEITTAAGCSGQVYGATVKPTEMLTGVLYGGGGYCLGSTVRLGITNTSADQTYTFRRDGVDVTTFNGIGVAQETAFDIAHTPPDTLWYTFTLTSIAQAGSYTVRTSNGSCTPINFGNALITAMINNTWNGSVSTAWTNPANWSCGSVPDLNSVVIIPAPGPGVPRMPVVTSNVSCLKLTVNPGATVTVNPPFKLTVTGTGP